MGRFFSNHSSLILLSAFLLSTLFLPSALSAKNNIAPDRIIVKFKDQATKSARKTTISTVKGCSIRKNISHNTAVVNIPPSMTVDKAVQIYQNDPSVEYAQPEFIYRMDAIPNDPEYSPEELPAIAESIEKAWDIITDTGDIVVAVMDTGINYNHEDIAQNMWTNPDGKHGYDFVNEDDDPMDDHGHGTHVAGIIGAVGNNGIGIAGTCWKTSLMAIKICTTFEETRSSDVTQGFDYAIANGADVINCSFGDKGEDPIVHEALIRTQQAGIIVVCSAGNDQSDIDESQATFQRPVCYPEDNIIGVGSLSFSSGGRVLAFDSNYGSKSVDLCAPRDRISAYPITEDNVFRSGFYHNVDNTLWQYSDNSDWFFTMSGLMGSQFQYPADYSESPYQNNKLDHIYTSFDLDGSEVKVGCTFQIQYETEENNDFINIYVSCNSADPFNPDSLSVQLSGISDGMEEHHTGILFSSPAEYATVGIEFTSNDSIQYSGVYFPAVSISRYYLNNNGYKSLGGTSMAAPYVAGIAALVKAYNPDYDYLDVIESVKNGGIPNSDLQGKTTTGREASLLGSLCYIKKPTGLHVEVKQ